MSQGCRCTARVRQAYREVAAVHGEGRLCRPFYDHDPGVAAVEARDACPDQHECGFGPGDDATYWPD